MVCETNKYETRVQVRGLSGTGLVLQNNGGDDLVIDAAGTHEFGTSVSSGAPYLVTIKTLPTPSGEDCQVSSGAGTVVDGVVDVLVRCVRQYTVFVTSTSYDGNLGGLAGADAKCQDQADAAGLTGTFKAWLSDAKGSPSTRFTRSAGAPYVLVDGTVIADNYAGLTSGSLEHPINQTETGGAPPVEPISAARSCGPARARAATSTGKRTPVRTGRARPASGKPSSAKPPNRPIGALPTGAPPAIA